MATPWASNLARAYAGVRGGMLLFFMGLLFFVPERVLPGSSSEPARSIALMFASRTLLLGGAMIFLALRRHYLALGFILLADAVLQVFDAGMALVLGRGSMAVFPLLLGALDAWAGKTLHKGGTGQTGT